MNRVAHLAVISISLCHQGIAQSNMAPSADSDPQKRHATYLQLNRQIYARHEDPGSGKLNFSKDKGPTATEQLHEMVTKEIGLALGGPKPSAQNVTSAISSLQGDLTLTGWDTDATNTPYAKFFTLNGVQTVAIAYVIMQGGDATPDTQTYLDFYDNTSGVWTKKATAPTMGDFEGCTFSVAALNSGLPGEAWFLAWGMPFGSSHASHHVRLYSFDGFTVHTIWKRDNLDGLRIKVTPDSVTLVYQDFDDVSIEHHQLFHVTGNGLELASDQSEHL